MTESRPSKSQRSWRHALRKAFSFLPRPLRFAFYRSFVDCDPKPDTRLVLKIADTKEELEACFKLLHDAYVGSGFMRPDASGMRATIYHALPTTTTLCAKFDGEVVGTISLIRESIFGFPLQAVFDLQEVKEKGGKIAEVSALAVHPKFRKTGGTILFPLMKFMYEYSYTYFDTRHLVIAVNPDRIEMYESLLMFHRLKQSKVDNYDFANGAPAVGAVVDLHAATAIFKKVYGTKRSRKNLYMYFMRLRLKNIIMPSRRYYTTNDPVMTPALLDYFFNRCTSTLEKLNCRDRARLRSIYDTPRYANVLPTVFEDSVPDARQRKHQRYSLKCPGNLTYAGSNTNESIELRVVEVSETGFLAYSKVPVHLDTWGSVEVQLGVNEKSKVNAKATRGKHHDSYGFYGFQLGEPDLAWKKFVGVLKSGITHDDMDNATRFLTQ
jgi:hypothetical protein